MTNYDDTRPPEMGAMPGSSYGNPKPVGFGPEDRRESQSNLPTLDLGRIFCTADFNDRNLARVEDGLYWLVTVCHGASFRAGWWHRPDGALETDPRAVVEKIALIHSEISEAMEADRKGLMDDKLPDRAGIEVELADAMIRIADLAGALGLDLGGAVAEKLEFNARRADHKPENRAAPGGKRY